MGLIEKRYGFTPVYYVLNDVITKRGPTDPLFSRINFAYRPPRKASVVRPRRLGLFGFIHYLEEIMTMNCDLFGDYPGLGQRSAKLTGDPSDRVGEYADLVGSIKKGELRCQQTSVEL